MYFVVVVLESFCVGLLVFCCLCEILLVLGYALEVRLRPQKKQAILELMSRGFSQFDAEQWLREHYPIYTDVFIPEQLQDNDGSPGLDRG